MKANVAPEKIYCESDSLGNIVKAHNIKWPDDEAENIEYIRTDVFIEKTCEWMENNLQGIVGGSIYIEDFKEYLRGE